MQPIDDFQINKKSDIPIWVQLRQRLTQLIRGGMYKPGDQLPTVRQLAIQLGVNYHTVNKVYQDLEHDGYIEKMVGRGTFVTDLANVPDYEGQNNIDFITEEFIHQLFAVGMSSVEIFDCVARHLGINVEELFLQSEDSAGESAEGTASQANGSEKPARRQRT